jgi:hypothetical protein
MFLAAATAVLLPGGVRFRGIGTIRGPWILAFCGFYVGVGIGLLKLRRWARVTAIAITILDVGLLGVALVNGLLKLRLAFLLAYLLRLPLYGLVVWYLLRPEIRLAFEQQVGMADKPDTLQI